MQTCNFALIPQTNYSLQSTLHHRDNREKKNIKEKLRDSREETCMINIFGKTEVIKKPKKN